MKPGAPADRLLAIEIGVPLRAVRFAAAAFRAMRPDGTEVHQVDADHAVLRTLFLRSCVVPRAVICAVDDAPPPRRGDPRLGIGTRWLRITLGEAVLIRGIVGARPVTSLYVAADDPPALAHALIA